VPGSLAMHKHTVRPPARLAVAVIADRPGTLIIALRAAVLCLSGMLGIAGLPTAEQPVLKYVCWSRGNLPGPLDGQCAVSCRIIPAASMIPQCSISAPFSTRK